MMGNELTAEKYIVGHWKAKKVYNNLAAPKHQDRLQKCAELTRGSRLADVGCAFGHSTAIMQDFRPGNWRGFDLSATAITEARKFFPDMEFDHFPNINSMHKNLARFKLDSIVCSEVLEHVADDRSLVLALWNAVSERVVFTTPSVKVNDPGHIRLYNEAMLEKLFEGIPHTLENTGLFWYIVCHKDADSIVHGSLGAVEADAYLIPPDEEVEPVEVDDESEADEPFWRSNEEPNGSDDD